MPSECVFCIYVLLITLEKYGKMNEKQHPYLIADINKYGDKENVAALAAKSYVI